MALATGSLLAGRYEITAPIATGGMGEVWKARDRVLDRIVAAKVLKSEYTGDPNFLARFRNEARHTAALTHQNIASVYDYGETVDDTGTQQLAFLVMEFVEGQPLVTILHDEGALPVDWTLHVLSQSADGLSAAHRAGVVHRDIKPGNLMVRPDGVVKLTDFGIAQARDATPLTRTGMVVGTAQYLSPEQAQGMEVTAASDVYSLGVVGYECLAGVRPFDGASQVAIALAHINRPPPPLPSHVPPAVRLLVERALAKDPADRFPDGGAFAEAIRRVAAGGTLAPVAPVAGPRTTPTQIVGGGAVRRRPGRRGAGGRRPRRVPHPGDPGDRTRRLAAAAGPADRAARPDAAAAGTAGRRRLGRRDDDEPRRRPRAGGSGWPPPSSCCSLLAGGTWFLLNDGNRGTGGAAAGTTTAADQRRARPASSSTRPPSSAGPPTRCRPQLEAAGLVGHARRTPTTTQLAERRARRSTPATSRPRSRPGVLAPPGTEVVALRRPERLRPRAGTSDAPHRRPRQPTTSDARPRRPPPPTTTTAADHDDAPPTSTSAARPLGASRRPSDPPPAGRRPLPWRLRRVGPGERAAPDLPGIARPSG